MNTDQLSDEEMHLRQTALLMVLGAVTDTAFHSVITEVGVPGKLVSRMSTYPIQSNPGEWDIVLHNRKVEKLTDWRLPKGATLIRAQAGQAKYIDEIDGRTPLDPRSKHIIRAAQEILAGHQVHSGHDLLEAIKKDLNTAYNEALEILNTEHPDRDRKTQRWVGRWMAKDKHCPYEHINGMVRDTGTLTLRGFLDFPVGEGRGRAPAHFVFHHLRIGGYKSLAEANQNTGISDDPDVVARMAMVVASWAPVPLAEQKENVKEEKKNSRRNAPGQTQGLLREFIDYCLQKASKKHAQGPEELGHRASVHPRSRGPHLVAQPATEHTVMKDDQESKKDSTYWYSLMDKFRRTIDILEEGPCPLCNQL